VTRQKDLVACKSEQECCLRLVDGDIAGMGNSQF